MALGLQTESGGGGDFAEIVKYDARAGRMFRIDRSQGTSGWETAQVEVTNGFAFVPDLDNIQVGWAHLATGQAPSWVLVPLGSALPARPSDQYKQVFKMMTKLGAASGGDVREFASQAKVVISAIDALHTAFEAQRSANPGKLPVVALKGTTPVVSQGKGQSSTNYAPVFEIVKWVDRPADLPTPAPGHAVAQPAPAVAVATPAPASQPAPAMAGEEF